MVTELTAEELHNLGDRATCAGDYETAGAYRLLEGNARAGQVIRQWVYQNLLVTEGQIVREAERLALMWGASIKYLHQEAMKVLQDAARSL